MIFADHNEIGAGDWRDRWGVGPGPGGGTGVLLSKILHWPNNPIFDAVHATDFYDIPSPQSMQFPREEMTNAHRNALKLAAQVAREWIAEHPDEPFALFDFGPDPLGVVREAIQQFLDTWDTRTPPWPEPPDQSCDLGRIVKAASNPYGYYVDDISAATIRTGPQEVSHDCTQDTGQEGSGEKDTGEKGGGEKGDASRAGSDPGT